MQGGKLIISRGMNGVAEAPAARREPARQAPPEWREPARQAPPEHLRIAAVSEPASLAHGASATVTDYHLYRQRLDALERLSLLRDIGVLTPEEFAAEKALVLRLPADELLLEPDDMLPPRGPSLLGRLLSWKMLAAGAIIGLCISAFTAPQDLMTLADRASRLIG